MGSRLERKKERKKERPTALIFSNIHRAYDIVRGRVHHQCWEFVVGTVGGKVVLKSSKLAFCILVVWRLLERLRERRRREGRCQRCSNMAKSDVKGICTSESKFITAMRFGYLIHGECVWLCQWRAR